MFNHLLLTFWNGFVYGGLAGVIAGAIVMTLFLINNDSDKEIEQPIAGDGIMGEVLTD